MAKANSAAKKKTSAAARQARASLRKRLHNQTVRNRIRSGLRGLDEVIKGDAQKAVERIREIISWIDRAAKTGVLHSNAASRYKSRLMLRMKMIKK
ncbi:MAG: 30S ribosomal protein S20 [Verrucomicrobiae bacterium]|nr:30S ribosomal protein S20 [Verrucomicrobiae bacterium]